MLSIRQRTIIQCILGHPEGISGNQLAEEFRVSPKTIRNDIADMNRLFAEQGCLIYAARKNGYYIKEENREELLRIMGVKCFHGNIKEAQTPQERRMAILDRVLGCPGSSIDSIAEIVCVSEPTVYKDLAQLRQELKKQYGFTGMCVREHCVCMDAPEREIRHLVFRMITSNIMKSGQMLDANLYQLMRGIYNLSEVHTFYEYTVQYCRMRKLVLSDSLLYIAAWMIFYTNVRREEAFFLEPAESFSRQDELAGFLDFMNQKLFLEFEDCDFAFVYRELEALGFSLDVSGQACLQLAGAEEIKQLVEEFFQKLAKQYRISFSEPVIKQDFLRDMICLVKRIQNDSQFQEFPENTSENMFALSYQAAMMMTGMLNRKYHVRITAPEIRKIARYVESLTEKTHGKVSVQMITCSDMGRFYQVRQWIQEKVGSWVQLCEPCPRYLFDGTCRSNAPDLLIAAEKSDIQTSIPELILSGPLTHAEERRLRSFLDEVYMKKQLTRFFTEILTDKTVLFFEEAVSTEEALFACGRVLKASGCIASAEAYCAEAVERERSYPSLKENGCLFLQPYDRTAVSDGICMGICRHPGNEFAILFAGAFSPYSEMDFERISSEIRNLLKKQEIISRLRDAPDAKSALKILGVRSTEQSAGIIVGGF